MITMQFMTRASDVIGHVRTYGIARTAQRTTGFARRHLYAKLISSAIALKLPYQRMARSVWRDQSDDAAGMEIFSALLKVDRSTHPGPVMLAAPNYLMPVLRYLKGMFHPGSRIVSYDDLKAGAARPDIVILNRLTMGPLSDWFEADGQGYGCLRQNAEYALLISSDMAGAAALHVDPAGLRPAFRDTFSQTKSARYESHGVAFSVRPESTDRLLVEETWHAYIEWLAEIGVTSAHRVLDLGAHIGGFSLHAAAHLKSQAIVAIEAAPENFALLRSNIDANGFTNIIRPIWSAALDRDDTISLTMSSDHTGVHKVEHGRADSVQVPSLDIARIFDETQPFDMLKIDIEGSEIPVFKRLGARLKDVPVIIGELHASPFGGPEQALAILQAAGFQVALRGDALIPAFLAIRK